MQACRAAVGCEYGNSKCTICFTHLRGECYNKNIRFGSEKIAFEIGRGESEILDIFIPDTIKRKIGSRTYSVDKIGMSNSKVLLFDDMVLKIERQREESDNEYKMLTWLEGRLPVPEVIGFERENGINYLLMSRVEGEMLCSDKMLKTPGQLVEMLTEGLNLLQNVDITDCPCRNTIDNKLRLAEIRVRNGLCSMDDVEPETYGEKGFHSPWELLVWLKENKPQEQLVFSHGDYCLPNIFVKNQAISGFLDLGRSGIADIYQDIALCYRSLKYNFDGTYGGWTVEGFDAGMLFGALQIQPDWEKIRYYILLDELF